MPNRSNVETSLHFILIPHARQHTAVDRPLSRMLLNALHKQSQDLFGSRAVILSYEAASKTFHPLPYDTPQKVGTIFAGRALSDHFFLNRLALIPGCNLIKRSSDCINFYNPSFFLFDSPCHRELTEAGNRHGLALCAQMSSCDLYGVCWNRKQAGLRLLHEALRCLTWMEGDETSIKQELLELHVVPPSLISYENSAAMDGVRSPTAGRAPDAPIYLNTAYAEALFSGTGMSGLTDDLRLQRGRSRTPWLFNALLNTLEYAHAAPQPDSLPPEIHVSSTGLCNLSCRFCTYTPEVGKSGWLTPDGLKNLPVLKSARVLRLSAGLGEPTINPMLPDILRWVAAEHPHIAMNFFTNGLEMPDALLQTLIDVQVSWINISLNASNAAAWADCCGTDKFPLVTGNLERLRHLKRERRSLQPLVFASTVLTRQSMHDLPALPELCAQLGIDRVSGFPFFAFGYGGTGKYGPEDCFNAGVPSYETLYEETLLSAEACGISIELPLPESRRGTPSIMAERVLHDFCRIEQNQHRLDKLLQTVLPAPSEHPPCFFLWRQASIGSVNRTLGNIAATHYLYPCLGPLSGMNLTAVTPVDFAKPVDFFALWNNPFWQWLRRAQLEKGLCTVCEQCMAGDTRDPARFALLNECLEKAGMDGSFSLKNTA